MTERAARDARSRVAEAGGRELLERLDHLERSRGVVRPAQPPLPPAGGDRIDFDVAIAGGGLWSILAPLLAARGLRVVVLDRARVGVAHREWNASARELDQLVACGLLDQAELAGLIVARYREGTCRFQGGGSYPVPGVLDCAVDAGALLALGRRAGELRGVTYLDGHALLSQSSSAEAVRLSLSPSGAAAIELTARLMVDARGATSPFATADLLCPTVGGVVSGLREGSGPREVDPAVGEILATVDGIDEGRQHVWEAFPGRRGETAVYLFYYAQAHEPFSLIALYSRFFASLPSYKDGAARLLRPTFGLIPGWSRLAPPPRSPDRRVVLVGDAAARHSPLTYCGFGATLRSLRGAADALVKAVERAEPTPACILDDAPVHGLTGALAYLMASRAFRDNQLNLLLDAAFRTLHEMGPAPYAALLRDEMDAKTFVRFLRTTAACHPAVWGKVLRGMGLRLAGRWGLSVVQALRAGPG